MDGTELQLAGQRMPLNRGATYREQIGVGGAGRTVLEYLERKWAHSTAEVWAARVASGEVTLDGRPANADEALRPGHRLVWHRPPWHEPDVPVDFRILYEDGDLLAVDKPAGLPTMPAGGFLTQTLLMLLRDRCSGVAPLHRLGRFTSGVVLFARSSAAARAMTRAWHTDAVVKQYRALASGVIPSDRADIAAPIGRVPHPVLGSVYAASAMGRTARTEVTVLERRRETTLCDVRIRTGRPHQIRIHLAWFGHPLAGDPLYGAGGHPHEGARALPGEGGYHLHAHRLTVPHPRTDRPVSIEAPPPALLAPR